MTQPGFTPVQPGGAAAPRPLHFWHGLAALFIAVLLMMFFYMGLALVVSNTNFKWPLIALTIVASAAVFGFCARVTVQILGHSPRRILIGDFPGWVPCLVAALGMIPLGFLTDEVTFLLARLKPDIFTTSEIIEFAHLFQTVPITGFVILAAAISIAPAIGEELLFRGTIFQSFRRDMPVPWAIVYSSILFGVVHFSWFQGTGAGLGGLYLGFVVYATSGIHAAVHAHFVNNLLSALMARFWVSDFNSLVERGYPAGVLIAAAIFLIFCIWLLWRMRTRTHPMAGG